MIDFMCLAAAAYVLFNRRLVKINFPSIRDGVHRNENFVVIIPVFSTFCGQKKKIYIRVIM